MDPGMNQLLKWSVENSTDPRADPTSTSDPKAVRPSGRPLNAEALAALMGGPSDADLMKDAMSAIVTPSISLENKLTAFDNFEQLIETIDNANNMSNLGLWTPLIRQLDSEVPELRKMAAWCIGTAAQNNIKSQETVLTTGALTKLISKTLEDKDGGVRKKAVYALSSSVRNYQPAVDLMVEKLPREILGDGVDRLDASDMDGIDSIMEKLRAIAKETR
ncbi:MAG: hsp70 nucleotide exchange factor fes1 [Sclerophora amabilis]|nr:MAG: hsp70 nucleotide exchange factor fes1 [Sclerophora amabilis]